MSQKITIVEEGTPETEVKPKSKSESVDEQDILVASGTLTLTAGFWYMYPPAGAIVFGALMLFFAYLIERSKKS